MTFARTYFEHFTMAQNLELCLRLVVAFVVSIVIIAFLGAYKEI